VTRTTTDRAREWFDAYTRDLSHEDLQRLFTHDTREAYEFFTRSRGEDPLANLPWWKRVPLRARQVFVAFTLKLSPARRAVYIGALLIAVLGLIRLFRGFAVVSVPLGTPFFQLGVPMPAWEPGTVALIVSFVLVNLLILMEVADRLSLKGELEIAREIQLAMLPKGTLTDRDLEICGVTRPANTVGGDFYDVLPRPDGRVIVALGDVAGKGSPAALLMALLLAVLRTLVDEDLDARELVARLNVQICRHTPASRFITLFYGVYSPDTGSLTYVNAGQNPPLIRRANGRYEQLGSTGVALGMFEHSTFGAVTTTVARGEMLVMYSDGITEAEDSKGQPLEESGLERVIEFHAAASAADIGHYVLKAVEAHANDTRFHDDLTILILKRHQSNA
jgi:sigma-B regulation protein RsbU (phosphoserine phosphatase)